MTIRIALADDHNVIREGLRLVLERQADMRVVAEAEDGRAAVTVADEFIPDVVIMDVAMPCLGGIEATRAIVGRYPAMKVLALSMHTDRRYVDGMLQAGAAGYLLKDCISDDLVDAVRAVVAGQRFVSRDITDGVW
jgi:DNA-binding NarL/FixJ family response regulator